MSYRQYLRPWFSLCFIWCAALQAQTLPPSFTGPLLAPAAQTTPFKHHNLETYLFFTDLSGVYNSYRKVTHTPGNKSYAINPLYSYGLTSFSDIQYSIPYNFNQNQGAFDSGFSDVSVTLGFQVLTQKPNHLLPDLRVTLQTILPSGNYQNLNPNLHFTDATGLGSYQTALNLNFGYLFTLNPSHVVRTRLSLGYTLASPVKVTGYSIYGGSANTIGKIHPGNMLTLDAAAEFNLTEHWVGVMETFISSRSQLTFNGFPGLTDNTFNQLNKGITKALTLAPAIEYNLNQHLGFIAGPWFTLRGKETAQFLSYVVAVNFYW